MNTLTAQEVYTAITSLHGSDKELAIKIIEDYGRQFQHPNPKHDGIQHPQTHIDRTRET